MRGRQLNILLFFINNQIKTQKERQPVELPHDRGPISWKNNHLYFYLVSSLLEVPEVLIGRVNVF